MASTQYIPSPLAKVQCIESNGRSMLVFVKQFRHSAEKLWRLLTEPEYHREWAPFESDRNLSTLGTAKLIMIDRDVEMKFDANVNQSNGSELLEYTWGTDVLRWELRNTSEGCCLTLHHTTSARDWVPKVAAGWHICLDVANYFLDGNPMGRIVGEDAKKHGWTELHDAYAAALNIEGTGLPEDLSAPK
ncbi:MAG: SRPBCC domain-containing protein [Methylococcales bacterium]